MPARTGPPASVPPLTGGVLRQAIRVRGRVCTERRRR